MPISKLCKRGHSAPRTAKSECVECKRLTNAAHYRANSETYKRRARDWQAAQPSGWRDEYHAGYRVDNKDKRNAYGRIWNKVNVDKKRALTRNRKAAKRTAGTHTGFDVCEIRAAQNDTCFYCEESLNGVPQHVDHFIPLSKSGSNDRWNIVVACGTCNLRKSDKSPILFMNFVVRWPHFWAEKDAIDG